MEIRADIEKYKLSRKMRLANKKANPNGIGSNMYMDEDRDGQNSPHFAQSDDEDEEFDQNNMDHY